MGNSLRSLSNDELRASLKSLKGREDRVLVEILEHIQEFERRRLYLSLGYPNLYAYLTKELGYSESAAFRRIESARFLYSNPELKPLVDQGRLTLTSISEIRIAVRAQEKVTNKTVDRTEQVNLARAVIDCSRKEAQKILAHSLPDYKPLEYERKQELVDGGIQITLRLTKPQRLKTDKAKDIMARTTSVQSTGLLLEKLCDFYLRKKDLTVVPTTQRLNPRIETVRKISSQLRSSIPMANRRAVFRRDRGRCQFQGPDGKLCGTTFGIEIDHILPVSRGGTNEVENLRCLCRAHNQWKADRVME